MLLWIEGFEGFGQTENAAPAPSGVVERKYPHTYYYASAKIEAGRFGGKCMKHGHFYCEVRTPALTTHSTLVSGVAVRFTTFPGTYEDVLSFFDGATVGMNVRVITGGEIAVYLGGAQLAATSGLGLTTGAWYYLEFKVTTDDTSGSYVVRINESVVLSGSGVDTQPGSNAYHTAVQLGATGTDTRLDDWYVLDGSGSDNNDFLGNCKVEALRPNGAGSAANWTPSSGANYACVDEAEVNDDTDYVETAAAVKDLYAYGNLSGIQSGIKGVQINTQTRETDANTHALKTLVKSGTTESADAGQNVGVTSFTNKHRVLEKDPNTDSSWLPAGINGAEFGIQV